MQVIAGTDFSRRRRGPFLAPIEIVLLAAIVGALLYLLFPGRDFENPRHLTKADDLSMAYLRMLLRAHPGDGDARLLLVQQQVALGRMEEAAETLRPLRGRTDALGHKAEVVALKLDRTRLYALPSDSPERLAMQGSVGEAARKLMPSATRVEDIADLADFVLALGDPAEAARAYRRLATIDTPNSVGWLEKAGRWFYAAGNPAEAAKVYSEGALSAADPRQGARMGRLALLALQAANQGKAGMALAKPIVEKYPRDLGLLEQALRMAVGAGELQTARRWGEQRVIAAGSSDQALREQVDILTKAGDPVGAFKVAKGLLARNPNDSALHKQVAQLARWSSDPEESMKQWTWLARRGNEDAREKALELAQALADADAEVELIEMRMKKAKRMAAPKLNDLERYRKPPPRLPRIPALAVRGERRRPLSWAGDRGRGVRLAAAGPAGGPSAQSSGSDAGKTAAAAGTPAPEVASSTSGAKSSASKPGSKRSNEFELSELIALADALENKGLPERAIKAMDDFRFNFADRPDYWVRIARLYENAGELEQALACFEQLNRLKAMTLDDAIRQSKLLWRLLRPEAALTRLVGLREQAKESDKDYWRLVGMLAWRVENDLLGAEAFSILWKTEKTADVAEPLFRTLDSLGRIEDAINVAEEAYGILGQTGFLVSAVDIAVREGMNERAKALFTKARGKEKQFELESHFWFQRAQLAFGEERYDEAEQDLQRVLAIDPGSEEAHVEWLTVAVHAQDRGMAERALSHWGPGAESDADSWGLLSDAYALTNEEAQSQRFRRMARDERIRQRIASGRPMTPEEHVEDAVERRDKRAVEVGLKLYGTTLSLPMRVAALRELGRDEDAWELLSEAGLTSPSRRTGGGYSENALALAADIRDLRENYLDGIWAFGHLRNLGALEERNYGARFELRWGDFFLGAEGSYSQLFAAGRQVLVHDGNEEKRAFLLARMRKRFGETTLRAGYEILPEGRSPHVELKQRLVLLQGRIDASIEGIYGELPAYSSVLRAMALRDAIEADLLLQVAGPFEVAFSGTMGRFVTRYLNPLTTEKAAKVEMAFRLPFRSAYVRPRVDGFTNVVPRLTGDIPREINDLVNRNAEFFDPDDVLGLQYSTAGLGLTLGSMLADVGEARGPHVSLRYQFDVWGGYVWPAQRAAYAADGSLGLVFARHQELSVHGFFYSDFRNFAGENWWGGSVNYTLRWFR
jgi:tetratricopeptide (TPR) repeat protein